MNIKHHQKNDVWNNHQIKKQVIKYFKKGYSIGKICRRFHLDVSSVLFILKTGKIRKTVLYKIYKKQEIRNENKVYELILESEKYHLDKFFPNVTSDSFTTSYYYYWKKEFDTQQKRKDTCKHSIKHIRCSICSKILADASNININNLIIKKYENAI